MGNMINSIIPSYQGETSDLSFIDVLLFGTTSATDPQRVDHLYNYQQESQKRERFTFRVIDGRLFKVLAGSPP